MDNDYDNSSDYEYSSTKRYKPKLYVIVLFIIALSALGLAIYNVIVANTHPQNTSAHGDDVTNDKIKINIFEKLLTPVELASAVKNQEGKLQGLSSATFEYINDTKDKDDPNNVKGATIQSGQKLIFELNNWTNQFTSPPQVNIINKSQDHLDLSTLVLPENGATSFGKIPNIDPRIKPVFYIVCNYRILAGSMNVHPYDNARIQVLGIGV